MPLSPIGNTVYTHKMIRALRTKLASILQTRSPATLPAPTKAGSCTTGACVTAPFAWYAHRNNNATVTDTLSSCMRPIAATAKEQNTKTNYMVCMLLQKLTAVQFIKKLPTHEGSQIYLTLYLLTWRIWWVLNNASRWQMGFNLAFKGLKQLAINSMPDESSTYHHNNLIKIHLNIILPSMSRSPNWQLAPLPSASHTLFISPYLILLPSKYLLMITNYGVPWFKTFAVF